MAMRRLLLPVALVFFVLIVLSSTLSNDQAPTRPPPQLPPLPQGSLPRTVDATLPKDRVVHARVGDLVNLEVDVNEVGGVEVPALGQVEAVAPGSPAQFTIVPAEAGSYVVQMSGSGRVLGRIVVRGPKGASQPAQEGTGGAPPRGDGAPQGNTTIRDGAPALPTDGGTPLVRVA
jgi:hypothetical protein